MPERDEPVVSVELTAREWEDALSDPVYLSHGYILPRRWSAHALMPDGIEVDLVVEVVAEAAGDRARTTDVAVHSAHGISWDTLARLPVRNLAATACREAMWRTTVTGGKSVLERTVEDSDELHEIVRGLVGYRPTLYERSASLTARAGIRTSGEVVKRRRTT
jgi:hypothetical protein